MSRAGLLKAAGVGAVAAAAVGLELGKATGSALATDGGAIIAGTTTTAEHATTVQFDGSGSPGVVLLSNDTGFSPSEGSYPAALGGWASSHVPSGVYGYTETSGGGNGVVGYDATGASGTTGVGVLGRSDRGTGVYGRSDSTDDDAVAVLGEMTSKSAGGNSAAVRGKHDGTSGLYYGVWGSSQGGGYGGYFTSVSGYGVWGYGGSGTGVVGSGVTGVLASGDTGLSANGATGIHAYGNTLGIYASTDFFADYAYAIHGEITNQAPGAGSAAVLGQSDGTAGNGYGVQGTHAGGGWGGYFTSVSGIGAYGNGGTGTGLLGTSTKGIGVRGTSSSSVGCYGTSSSLYGVYGSSTSSHGVFGNSTNGTGAVGQSIQSYGVYAQSTNSYGLHATGTTGVYAGGSASGRGVVGAGGAAQLQLVPSTASTHPSSGQAGDFFVDSADHLWFCRGGSTWVQLA